MFHQIKFCSIKKPKDPVMIELHIDRTNIFKKGAEQKFNFENFFDVIPAIRWLVKA